MLLARKRLVDTKRQFENQLRNITKVFGCMPGTTAGTRLRRDNQGERAYCLTGECYPASNRCLIKMLPLPHAPGAES
jgi:hypothetical protein